MVPKAVRVPFKLMRCSLAECNGLHAVAAVYKYAARESLFSEYKGKMKALGSAAISWRVSGAAGSRRLRHPGAITWLSSDGSRKPPTRPRPVTRSRRIAFEIRRPKHPSSNRGESLSQAKNDRGTGRVHTEPPHVRLVGVRDLGAPAREYGIHW